LRINCHKYIIIIIITNILSQYVYKNTNYNYRRKRNKFIGATIYNFVVYNLIVYGIDTLPFTENEAPMLAILVLFQYLTLFTMVLSFIGIFIYVAIMSASQPK